MAEWTQPGFAVIADGHEGLPMVASFRPGRFMAERDLEKNRLPEGVGSPSLEKMALTLRIVPATLTFDDGNAE